MKKTWWMSVVLLFMGLGLVAASVNEPLPSDYWDMPQAKGKAHIGLENNMRPEACAQCHEAQFNAWRDSKHAHAYSPGLVGQFPGAGHGAGNECLVCHAPLAEQLYRDEGDLAATLSTLLENPEGFSRDADLDAKQAKLPLRHAGVTCAVCHVRNGQRFGPPRRGSDVVGHLEGAAHGGFIATKDFEKSQLCASCHQFPQSYAINGKPLENTVFEWQQSSFARQGVQCQTCHMPDRKHSFKGIHDVDMVRSGLNFKLEKKGRLASLTMTSVHIGHAFPTYVTPKIWVKADALNAQGKVLQHWQWSIVREVAYDDDWKETQDSRLMPGESRIFIADNADKNITSVRFYIDVIPDAFYKGVYQSLLADNLQPKAKLLITKALSDADKNDYRLYENEMQF
ncbi:MAG: hypothetical protein Q9M14_01350 [Mariprofundaceae bacterium]|nr:hypothetical protein [Mariprofundaceae bacterium]